MKRTRCVLAVIMVIFLMCLDLVMNTSIHAKPADDLLTFDFEKTTVTDALQQITRVTGIKIHINKPFHKVIVGKSFLEADLEYILRDLFWQENVAIEWLYGQRSLDTVFITIYENQKDQSATSPFTRPLDYGSNVPGNIPVPFNNQASVLGNATKSRENNQVPESSKALVPTPAPPVKHGLVPPLPMPPPGFLSR
jgi:hypothetical protein